MDRINDARLQSMPEDDIFDRSRKDRFRREIESERILRDDDLTPEEQRIKSVPRVKIRCSAQDRTVQ